MTATQTLLSASLAVLLAAAPSARADDEAAPAQPPGEVRPRKLPLLPKRAPTGTFEIGAGYSTDDKLIAVARVEQASLFGTGKQLSLSTTITSRLVDGTLAFYDPALLGSQLRLGATLYARQKQYVGFTRESYGGTLALARRIAPHTDVFVGYRGEYVRVEPGSSLLAARGGPAVASWRGGFISALRAGVSYSTLTELAYPRRGTSAGASVEIADDRLGSELAYTRTDAWVAHHRPLGPFTLHLGAKVSTITDVPLSERLHFDGSSDIRGYAPGAVGPIDPVTGLPTGGNLLWAARAELEAPLVPCADLHAAGFFDVGGLHAGDAGGTGAAAGVGLIWRSPIGPLRFDVAFPLDGGEPRYIFGIGGLF